MAKGLFILVSITTNKLSFSGHMFMATVVFEISAYRTSRMSPHHHENMLSSFSFSGNMSETHAIDA